MIYLIAIFAYLFILTGIAYYKSRQVKTQSDFSVAGRTLSPWILVCTMLAVWIGTGSIVGNAGQAFRDGMVTLMLPIGTFIGMIMLSLIATRARNIEAFSVPEIIGRRYGHTARMLAVIALVIAYMVIVSYQFNAGGMVLEVIAGKKDPVPIRVHDELTKLQLNENKRYVVFEPEKDWKGSTRIEFQVKQDGKWSESVYTCDIEVAPTSEILSLQKRIEEEKKKSKKAVNKIAIKENNIAKVFIKGFDDHVLSHTKLYRIVSLPEHGAFYLSEPKLTAHRATIIAAIFIIAYTMLAGLMSLAFTDIVTGVIMLGSLIAAFPVLLYRAGGFSGMEAAFAAMGDRPHHMQFWGVYSVSKIINFCLPVFLLVMGDANQYQRIFASRNAKGAKSAVTTMIFVALLVELLIIALAWIASSMIPDPANGRYVLIYAAKHFMPTILGIFFMVTVVGIIISTADSFLLVPATTFIKDIYQTHINPNASEKKIVFLSRILVLVFGIIAYLVSLAFAESTTVFKKALYAYTIYGSAITPSLIAALFWKGATKQGAIASILSGILITLVWEEVIIGRFEDKFPELLTSLDAVLPAITVSVLALFIVSRLTQKPKAS